MKKIFALMAVVFTSFLLAAGESWVSDFRSGRDGWDTQSYWGGRMAHENGTLHVTPTFSRNKYWARIIRSFKSDAAGKVLRMEAEVSGKGQVSLRSFVYGEDFVRGPGEFYLVVSGKAMVLNENWQKIQCDFDFRDLRKMDQFAMLIDLDGAKESDLRIRSVRLQDVTPGTPMPTTYLNDDHPELDGVSCFFLDQFGFLDKLGEDHEEWKGHHSRWGECDGTLAVKAVSDKKGSCARVVKLVNDPLGAAGRHYVFSGHFRGKGKIRLGYQIGVPDFRGEKSYSQTWSRAVPLTGEWQKLVYSFDFDKCAPADLFLLIETDGAESYFEADNTMLLRRWKKGVSVIPAAAMAMVRDGKLDRDLRFTVSASGGPVTLIPASSPTPLPGKTIVQRSGAVTVPAAAAGQNGKTYVATQGNAAYTMLLNLSPEEFDGFDALAKRFNPVRPLHVLIFGDSLLDKNFSLNREYSSMRQLETWLNRHHPGMARIDNRAVRGDTIQSVWERMEGKNPFEAQVYQNLFKAKADVIFIMLGHNDTRTDGTTKFTQPLIAPEAQLRYFRAVLKKLRATWPSARIVLVTPTTGNYELTSNLIARTLLSNPKAEAVLFGKPSLLEAYVGNLQKLAAEFHTEFYDVHTDMRALPQSRKAALFSPRDGVHLTLEGQKYMARLFLQYVVQMPPPKK